jgi:hypothetical protein
MITKDEALKLALEALENLLEQYYCNSVVGTDCDQAHDAITAIKQALAAPVQEPDELKHIDEQDCLLDVDEKAWRSLVENRGGCRCHISPPCGACSNPISEEELNEVGYTYTTPPAAQRQWVGLDAEDRWGIIYATERDDALRSIMELVEAKLKEKNT